MDIPAPIENHLRRIIAETSSGEIDDTTLNDFFQALIAQRFFPLPKQVKTLQFASALERMSDLKDEVRQRLTNQVRTLWQQFTPTGEPQAQPAATTPSADDPAAQPSLETHTDETTEAVATASGQPESASTPSKASPDNFFSTSRPKRDWFDAILDFVAGMIGVFK